MKIIQIIFNQSNKDILIKMNQYKMKQLIQDMYKILFILE